MLKLNYRRTILVGFAFMTISAFWQMYDNIIPLILKESFHMNDVVTGVIMAIDNILALFLLPMFGTLSDRCNTKIGKRMPFIIVGTVLSSIFMIFMPIADNSSNLIMFMTALGGVLLSMAIYRSPAVALMPDVTPKELRSKGNAVINLMGTAGAIYALVMIRLLVKKSIGAATPNYMYLFISLIVFMILFTVLLYLFVPENKWHNIAVEDEKKYGNHEEEEEGKAVTNKKGKVLRHRLPKDRFVSLIFLLLSVAFWYMAYNGVMSAFSRYAAEVWGMGDGGYTDCLMIGTAAAVIGYIPIGLLGGILGRKKSIIIGVCALIVGFAYVGLFGTYKSIIVIGFVLVGLGWAAINVNSFPMAVDIGEEGEEGRYTGFYYTASMAAQILTPILSGFFLQYVSYRTLFPYATVFSILALLTMLMVKHGDVKPTKKKSLLEHLDVDD
jgi:MFS family permease